MAVVGVLLLIGLIGFIVLIGFLKKKAVRMLMQKVFARGTYVRGKAATAEVIKFSSIASAEQFITTVLSVLNPSATLPMAFVAKLVVLQKEPGLLVVGYGNKTAMNFRSSLEVVDVDGGGSHGTYRVINWLESDGIVRAVPELELVANTIRTCASRLGTPPGPAETGEPLVVNATLAYCSKCGSSELGTRFCTDCGCEIPESAGTTSAA
jgi:hypothetical protein